MRGKIRTDRRTFLTSKLDWTEIDYAQRWRDSLRCTENCGTFGLPMPPFWVTSFGIRKRHDLGLATAPDRP